MKITKQELDKLIQEVLIKESRYSASDANIKELENLYKKMKNALGELEYVLYLVLDNKGKWTNESKDHLNDIARLNSGLNVALQSLNTQNK